jgi:hypothetical protein
MLKYVVDSMKLADDNISGEMTAKSFMGGPYGKDWSR